MTIEVSAARRAAIQADMIKLRESVQPGALPLQLDENGVPRALKAKPTKQAKPTNQR